MKNLLDAIYTGLANGAKPFATTAIASNIAGKVMRYPNKEFIAGFLMVSGSLTFHLVHFVLEKYSAYFRQFLNWADQHTDERTKQNIFYALNGLDKMLTRAGNVWAATDAIQLFVNTTLEQINADFEIPAELQRWLRPSIYFTLSFMVLADHLINTRIPRNSLPDNERTALINDTETNSAENSAPIVCSPVHHGLAFLENKFIGDFGFIWFILSFAVMCTPETVGPDVLPPYAKIVIGVVGASLLSCTSVKAAPAPASSPDARMTIS